MAQISDSSNDRETEGSQSQASSPEVIVDGTLCDRSVQEVQGSLTQRFAGYGLRWMYEPETESSQSQASSPKVKITNGMLQRQSVY